MKRALAAIMLTISCPPHIVASTAEAMKGERRSRSSSGLKPAKASLMSTEGSRFHQRRSRRLPTGAEIQGRSDARPGGHRAVCCRPAYRWSVQFYRAAHRSHDHVPPGKTPCDRYRTTRRHVRRANDKCGQANDQWKASAKRVVKDVTAWVDANRSALARK